jgi:hypothetical protein
MTNKLVPTRRDVLRGLGGLALTGIACRQEPRGEGGLSTGSVSSAALGVSPIAAVANRAWLPSTAQRGAIQAYAEDSVAAGGMIAFRVSSSATHQLSVKRLGWAEWTLKDFPSAAPAEQLVRPGSYIHVERALLSTAVLSALTLECWVRPFQIRWRGQLRWQGLISQYTFGGSCGFGLFIADDGKPACYFGDGGPFNANHFSYGTAALTEHAWSHVIARFASGTVSLWVNGARQTLPTSSLAAVTPGTSPLRLGAYGDGADTLGFLDGDLAMPVIYSRALLDSEIDTRAHTLPRSSRR